MGRSIREGLSREEKCYTEVAGILLDYRKEEIKVKWLTWTFCCSWVHDEGRHRVNISLVTVPP